MRALNSSAELEREIDALADLPRTDLMERWKEIFKEQPPKGLSLRLLRYAIAYELQVKHYGGLSTKAKKQLNGTVTNKQVPSGRNGAARPTWWR